LTSSIIVCQQAPVRRQSQRNLELMAVCDVALATVPAGEPEAPWSRQRERLEEALKAEAGARCCSTDGGSTVASSAGSPWVDMDDEDTYNCSISDVNCGAVDADVADARSYQDAAGTEATSLVLASAAQPGDKTCHESSSKCPSRHFLEALRLVGSREPAVATGSTASSVPVAAPSAPLTTPRRPRPIPIKKHLLDVKSAGFVSGSNTDPSRGQATSVMAVAESEAVQRPTLSAGAAADFLDPRIERSHFLQAVAILRERATRGDLPPRRPPPCIAAGCCVIGAVS